MRRSAWPAATRQPATSQPAQLLESEHKPSCQAVWRQSCPPSGTGPDVVIRDSGTRLRACPEASFAPDKRRINQLCRLLSRIFRLESLRPVHTALQLSMSLAERQPSKTAAPIEALRAIPILAYPIAAAVTATTLDGGGFSPGSQTILIVLAAIALLVAAFYDADALAVIARSPVAMILLLLGGLAALSSLWTIGQPSESLRWGLVILAYGAIVLSTGVLATRTGPWPIAAGIAGLAAIEAALGLGAAALHALPDAELASRGAGARRNLSVFAYARAARGRRTSGAARSAWPSVPLRRASRSSSPGPRWRGPRLRRQPS